MSGREVSGTLFQQTILFQTPAGNKAILPFADYMDSYFSTFISAFPQKNGASCWDMVFAFWMLFHFPVNMPASLISYLKVKGKI